jgi:hypothetical protein
MKHRVNSYIRACHTLSACHNGSTLIPDQDLEKFVVNDSCSLLAALNRETSSCSNTSKHETPG